MSHEELHGSLGSDQFGLVIWPSSSVQQGLTGLNLLTETNTGTSFGPVPGQRPVPHDVRNHNWYQHLAVI